jgi:hypothetical protein
MKNAEKRKYRPEQNLEYSYKIGTIELNMNVYSHSFLNFPPVKYNFFEW